MKLEYQEHQGYKSKAELKQYAKDYVRDRRGMVLR